MDFQYKFSDQSGVQVITLSGKLLGKEQSEALSNAMDTSISDGNSNFVMDLEKLSYMNSTGLNILISFLTKARNAGGELIITNVPSTINKLLIITKLNNVFHVEETLELAIEAMNSQPNDSE